MAWFDFLPWVRRRPQSQPRRRAYSGALSTNLNTDWRTSSASANSEIFTALRSLRNRSRDLYRNDPYAKSAVTTFVSSVIGKGMCLQAKVEKPRKGMNDALNTAIETEWERWAEKGNCTPDRRLSMAQLQRLALRAMVVDGEILIRIVRRQVGDSNVPVALELIEVDQLVETGLARAANGNRIILGVEVDEWNAAVAYHLYPYHPGDYQFVPQAKFQTTERVPADEIVHLYVMERPGQVRGVPWLHNVLDRIRNISGYEEAEIVRSRIQSCAVGAITSPEPDAMTDYTDAGEDYKFLSPGEILRLAPGETFTMGNAAAPNPSLEGFLRAMARSIAAGVGISYESLTRDYSNTSYSSARTALLAERDLYEVLQTEFIESFLCPFYRKHWLELAVLSGAVPINGYEMKPEFFQAHRWTRRGWPWVDPTKDIQASKEALQLKMTTLTRELATRGIDLEDLLKERAAEIELAKKYNINLELEVPQAQGGPAPEGGGDDGGKIAGEDDDAPLLPGMTPAEQPEEPEAAPEEEARDYPLMEGLTPIDLYSRAGKKGGAKQGKKCTTGQVCGLSCISKTKVCRKDLTPAQKPKAKTAKAKTTKAGGGTTQTAVVANKAEQIRDALMSKDYDSLINVADQVYEGAKQMAAAKQGDFYLGIQPGNGTTNDWILSALYKETGFDGLPEQVTAKKIDTYAAAGEVAVYRAMGSSNARFQQHFDNFKTGEYYAGHGIYGHGTYVAWADGQNKLARQELEKFVFRSEAAGATMGYGSKAMKMTLKADAKIALQSELTLKMAQDKTDFDSWERKQLAAISDQTQRREFKAKVRRAKAVMWGDDDNYNDHSGRYAVIRGIDAVKLDLSYSPENYMLLLNRSAVRVSKTAVTPGTV